MKHFWTTAAVTALCALSAPAWATPQTQYLQLTADKHLRGAQAADTAKSKKHGKAEAKSSKSSKSSKSKGAKGSKSRKAAKAEEAHRGKGPVQTLMRYTGDGKGGFKPETLCDVRFVPLLDGVAREL